MGKDAASKPRLPQVRPLLCTAFSEWQRNLEGARRLTFSVAEARPAIALKGHRERRGKEIDTANAKMTFSEAATLHMQHLSESASLEERTCQYWKETPVALLKHRPKLAETGVRRVTAAAHREWSGRHANIASSSRYNNTLSLLRQIFDVPIRSGIVHANPAAGLERKAIRPKHPELLARLQFAAFVAGLRLGHGRDS